MLGSTWGGTHCEQQVSISHIQFSHFFEKSNPVVHKAPLELVLFLKDMTPLIKRVNTDVLRSLCCPGNIVISPPAHDLRTGDCQVSVSNSPTPWGVTGAPGPLVRDLEADEGVWRRSIGLLSIKTWHPIRQIHFIFINCFVGELDSECTAFFEITVGTSEMKRSNLANGSSHEREQNCSHKC